MHNIEISFNSIVKLICTNDECEFHNETYLSCERKHIKITDKGECFYKKVLEQATDKHPKIIEIIAYKTDNIEDQKVIYFLNNEQANINHTTNLVSFINQGINLILEDVECAVYSKARGKFDKLPVTILARHDKDDFYKCIPGEENEED